MFDRRITDRDLDAAMRAMRVRREADAARTKRLDALLDAGTPLALAVRLVDALPA